ELLHATGEALFSDGRVVSTGTDGSGLEWRVETSTEGVAVRLALRNLGGAPVGVEQLRPLVAARGYRQLPLAHLKIQQTGWQSWSGSHPPSPFETNVHSAAPPIRGPHLPHRRSDSQLEPWMTVLEPTEGPGLLLGFVTAQHQLGTIEVIPSESGGHGLVAATELDGVELRADSDVVGDALLSGRGATSDI